MFTKMAMLLKSHKEINHGPFFCKNEATYGHQKVTKLSKKQNGIFLFGPHYTTKCGVHLFACYLGLGLRRSELTRCFRSQNVPRHLSD